MLGILERMILARKDAGMSQAAAARALDIGTTTLGDMERGYTPFPMDRLVALVELYDASIIWIMTGINDDLDLEAIFEYAQRMYADAAAVMEEITQ